MTYYENIIESIEYIKNKLPLTPEIGLVLGSGLGPMAEEIENPIYIPYADIPHFSQSTAPGHEGRFVCGMISGKYVICMQGRLHRYEGHQPQAIVHPIRVMKLLGVKNVVLTNAAGGINTAYQVGDFMLISDHINFTGSSPLIGENDSRLGARFNDMCYVYSQSLREQTKIAAKKIGIRLQQGVYMGVNGPQFETPAEIRAFRLLGADAVGMSTVFEAIAAAHCGLPVLGISMITNMAAGVLDQPLSGEEVNQAAERCGGQFRALVAAILPLL